MEVETDSDRTLLLTISYTYGALIILILIVIFVIIFWIRNLKKLILSHKRNAGVEVNSREELSRRGYSIHDGGLRALNDSYFNPPNSRHTPLEPPADYYDAQPGQAFVNKKPQLAKSHNMNERGTKDVTNDFTNILNRPDIVFGGDINAKPLKNPYSNKQPQVPQPQQLPYRNSNYNDNVTYGNTNNHDGKTYFNRSLNY